MFEPRHHYLIPLSPRFDLEIFNEVLFLAQVCECERSQVSEPGPTNKPFTGNFTHCHLAKVVKMISFICKMQSSAGLAYE